MKPKFNGKILSAYAIAAVAEPTPIGEIVLTAYTAYVITMYAYDLYGYYTASPPNGISLPWEPGTAPGPDWTWRGRTDNPADGDGNWVRGEKPNQESLHPDLDHPEPIGPHWDYIDQDKNKYRVFPDGTIEPK